MVVRSGPQDRGSALLCVLMIAALLGVAGAALALVVASEASISGNYQAAQQSLYAADAGVERAIGELRVLSTWQTIPAMAGSLAADFNDGQSTARAPDGSLLDFAQMTARRQSQSDAIYAPAPDRPRWQLFGHAPLNRMVPGAGSSLPYVVVWMADDPDDRDGDPSLDSNDILMVRAEAFGVRAGRRAVEATIRREEAIDAEQPGGVMRSDVRIVAWREVR
jgi:hypothetical protein